MSSSRDIFEVRRAALVARAAQQREALARQLAPLGAIDSGLGRLQAMKPPLPSIAMGAGLGLSALFLALSGGRFPLVRGGVAVLHLAGSLRRLFSRR